RPDSVPHADPMGRRAFIEEAAGGLKPRKRMEKVLVKLHAVREGVLITDGEGKLLHANDEAKRQRGLADDEEHRPNTRGGPDTPPGKGVNPP
ncbi:hypothetical protein ADK88_04740, partial [Streptomyces sp. NRRL F-2295]